MEEKDVRNEQVKVKYLSAGLNETRTCKKWLLRRSIQIP